MATEQQIPKLAGALVEHQDAFLSLPTEDAQWIIQNTRAAIVLFVGAVKARTKAVVQNILSVFKSVTIEATAEKKTTDCFTDKKRYYYCDPNFDNLLPEIQEAQPAGEITAHRLAREAKFVEMVQGLLGTTETDLAVLSRLAIQTGHVFTLPQIEALIERQETGEDMGLRLDSWANFFLVLNKNGSVSVVGMGWYGGGWSVFLNPLGRNEVWNVGCRFFSHNKTLGL